MSLIRGDFGIVLWTLHKRILGEEIMWDRIELKHLTFGVVFLVAVGGALRWFIDTLANRRRDRKQRKFARETQGRQEQLSKELADLRAEYEKKHTMHKVQFEREFEIYRDLWESLLRISTLVLTIDPYVSGGKDIEEKKEFCCKKINATINFVAKTSKIVNNNSPFYTGRIHELCFELTSNCITHLTTLAENFDNGIYTDKIGAALLEEIITPLLAKINSAIKERIGFIEESEIVE